MDLVKIKSSLESRINGLGFEAVSISTRREKGENILSVVVDRVEPIDMDTIVKVSQDLSSYLDEIDDSDTKYLLDVSSLGAEKPLKIESLKDYVGRYVHVHVDHAQEGMNIFEGELISVNEDSLTLSYRIKTRVKQIVILLSNIYKILLAIKF